MPVIKLPWYVVVVVKALMLVLKPILDAKVGVDLERTITAIILHVIGADDQPAAILKVQQVHECNGIGCSVEVKK